MPKKIGLTISNKKGTPEHRFWTWLNTGVDPWTNGKKKEKKKSTVLKKIK